jgi:hypothetical protein
MSDCGEIVKIAIPILSFFVGLLLGIVIPKFEPSFTTILEKDRPVNISQNLSRHPSDSSQSEDPDRGIRLSSC